MKPSQKVLLDFALAALQGIAAQPASGKDNAATVAEDAWRIADAMMQRMPSVMARELERADELWASTHS